MAPFGNRELSDLARQIISKERPLRCPRCKTVLTLDPPVRSGSHVLSITCPKCEAAGDVSYTLR